MNYYPPRDGWQARPPGIDEPLVRGGDEFFWADALGSVLRLTDATGAVTTSYRYDPFGRVNLASGSSTNPAQYTGRENDGAGLHYYRARYYHPILQRFISEDPVFPSRAVPAPG